MNKVKVLSIISIGLLIANLVLIWVLVSHKPSHHKRGGGPQKVIIEKLQLDEGQTKEYEKLIDGHLRNIRDSEQQIARLKNQLYVMLKDEEKANEVDSLISEIGKVQINIEHIHYNHFLDIKKLCRTEQIQAFDELTSEISDLFAPPRRPKPPGGRH